MNSRHGFRRQVALALVLLGASFSCTSKSPPRHDDSRSSPGALEATVAGRDAADATTTRAQGGTRMLVTVGSAQFTVTLEDNPTATAFRSMLPLTLEMTELNGNEKFYDLPKRLPADASKPGAIQAGDVMLYGESTLVLFYRTFRTSYSYTRIGKVDDPSGLAAAMGSGDVAVTFEL